MKIILLLARLTFVFVRLAPSLAYINLTIHMLWPHLPFSPLPFPSRSSRAPHFHHYCCTYFFVIIVLCYYHRPWTNSKHTMVMTRTLNVQKNVSFLNPYQCCKETIWLSWTHPNYLILINFTWKQNQCHEHTPFLNPYQLWTKSKLNVFTKVWQIILRKKIHNVPKLFSIDHP